jgi:hypothetical protein
VLLTVLVLAGALTGPADTPDPKPSPATPRPASKDKDKAKPAKSAASPPAPSSSPAPHASPATAASPGPKKGVYTNEDLPAEPSPAPSARPGSGRGTVTVIGPDGQAPVIPEEPTGPVAPEATEQFWRDRADGIRNNISTIEQQMATLQERISELRNDRSQANVMDPNREQTRQARIAETQAEYDRAAADLERVRQTLAALVEEARQKNIPSGWVR